ncbi:hypothetical protein PSAL_013520 [Pseudooceanicola algae]|uniref:Uncharacterized protein n=1 Tax=Pseudooceanicola algae TaxID=1537215 RepID=A0A418SJ35_9RHOB|nr:hypothetical protein PSAL_013520 [Pseudooceanicola algae]
MIRTCAMRGCANVLKPSNRSGVFYRHSHSAKCRCDKCCRRRGEAPPDAVRLPQQPAPTTRTDRRKATVTYPTGNSGIAGKVAVTVGRAPWEGDP